MMKLFHTNHDNNILNVDLQMLQTRLVLARPSNFYTVSTVFCHKDRGANFAVTNCMSHFSMFFPTKATVKLANGNTGHAQVIGVILCSFSKCSNIQWDQFMIVQVTLPTPPHQVTSILCWFSKGYI